MSTSPPPLGQSSTLPLSTLCLATPGISHSQPATTDRPLDSPPTKPDLRQLLCRPRPSPVAVLSRPRPSPTAVPSRPEQAAVPLKTKKESREGRRREKLPRQHSFLCCLSFPEDEEERRNCYVSTASCCCNVRSLLLRCLPLQLLPRACAAPRCILACIMP